MKPLDDVSVPSWKPPSEVTYPYWVPAPADPPSEVTYPYWESPPPPEGTALKPRPSPSKPRTARVKTHEESMSVVPKSNFKPENMDDFLMEIAGWGRLAEHDVSPDAKSSLFSV